MASLPDVSAGQVVSLPGPSGNAPVSVPLDAPLLGRALRGRVSTGAAQTAVIVAAVPMVILAVWLGLTSDHLQRPTAAALYRGYLIAAPTAIGMYWWLRRPASRFGPLLIGFGGVASVYALQSSDVPLLFDLGVIAEAPALWLTFYLFLAFPMGRLEGPAATALMTALAIVIAAFFLPWVLLSPAIAGAGALSVCDPACPGNVLHLASAPGLVVWLSNAETYGMLSITVGVLIVFAARVSMATRPQRRALLAVAATSLLFVPVFFAFHFTRSVLIADAGTVDTLGWLVVATRILLPLGFLAALWQAEFSASAALRRLVERLATRPSLGQWRDELAAALDDPTLQVGLRDPASGVFHDAAGAPLAPAAADSDRTWLLADRDGRPVAALVVDRVLVEDPELVRAAAAATLIAVENGHLEAELRASRARIVEAASAERRRLERDLHDSAQQRLVALRMHLGATGDQLPRAEDRAKLERLGTEVDDTIADLRSLARGIYPQVLADHGVARALTAAVRGGAVHIGIDDAGVSRQAPGVELAVYYCCLEALQNAGKHAGAAAVATVRLGQDDDALRFVVEDDGVGFDPAAVTSGSGLTNLGDRMAAAGGTLRIESVPGRGTRVIGRLPLSA